MSEKCSYCGGGYQVIWVDVDGDALCLNCADDTGLEKQLADQLHKLMPGYYWGAYLKAAEYLLGTFAEVWGGAYQQGVSDKREADMLQIDVGVGVYAQPDRANPFRKWAENAVKNESEPAGKSTWWEYGLQDSEGYVSFTNTHPKKLRERATLTGETVVRRRPAGKWERFDE